MSGIGFYAVICSVVLSADLFATTALVSDETLLSLDLLQSLESFTQIECPLKAITRKPPNLLGTKKFDLIPLVKIKESTSLNWSGYAALTNLLKPAKHSVTAVAGAWTVPTLSATPDDSYSSFWVGIDGYSSKTVEQIGTEHDWINGAQQNYAWFGLYPRNAFQIVGFPVNNGDVIAGSVTYVGKNTFQLVISNFTQEVFTIVPSYYTKCFKADRSSAEWIIEAPSSGITGNVLPLANFGVGNFINCLASIRGHTDSINSSHWVFDPLTMETPTNIIKALPSDLSPDGESFSVTWYHE